MKASVSYAQSSQGKFPGIQCLVTALRGVFALISQRESKLQSNLSTTTTLRKRQGDRYIQGDHYNYTGQLCRNYKATENFGKLSNFRRPTDEWLRHIDIYFLATTIICSLSTLNIQGNCYIQGCFILVCIHWHDKFSRLKSTTETKKFMLQLSTQRKVRFLGQSQVPFTDTITLKKRNKIVLQGHN